MFVYLSLSGGRVELPTAVDVHRETDGDYVRFMDEAGKVVAIFRRADTVLHTETDMGAVARLDELNEGVDQSPG